MPLYVGRARPRPARWRGRRSGDQAPPEVLPELPFQDGDGLVSPDDFSASQEICDHADVQTWCSACLSAVGDALRAGRGVRAPAERQKSCPDCLAGSVLES